MFETITSAAPTGQKRETWQSFLKLCGIDADPFVRDTVCVYDEGELVATASLDKNIIKCVAVSPYRQGEGLTGTLMTEILNLAYSRGERHLSLYTKPANEMLFTPLGFSRIIKGDGCVLMENRRNGVGDYISSVRAETAGRVGAIVANCNPFTLGHRYLAEQAAKVCDFVYFFVLSEDKSAFSASERLGMARAGLKDLQNVLVRPSGRYMISSATFPTYFIKDKARAADVYCDIDIRLFGEKIAPNLGITERFVGTEPRDEVTGAYNRALAARLPEYGITLNEIPRLKIDGEIVSASTVRKCMHSGNVELLRTMLPETTREMIGK